MGDSQDSWMELGSLRLLEHSIYGVSADAIMHQNEEIEKTNIMIFM